MALKDVIPASGALRLNPGCEEKIVPYFGHHYLWDVIRPVVRSTRINKSFESKIIIDKNNIIFLTGGFKVATIEL